MIDLRGKGNSVYFIGDIHGEFGVVRNIIKTHKSGIYIFCGDIGMGFHARGYYTQAFNRIQKVASDRGSHVVFVRGNHDDPSYFDGDNRSFCDGMDRVNMAASWDIVLTDRGNVLCIGGANSVDKIRRREGIEWWSGETIIEKDPDSIYQFIGDTPINAICSHTAPGLVDGIEDDTVLRYYDMMTPGLIDRCNGERRYLNDVLITMLGEDVKGDVTDWFHGHFHRTYTCSRMGVKIHSLNINELRLW